MLRLLADENFDHDLVRGAMRRRAGLDLTRAQSVGLSETDDPDILAWAAREQRIVLTHDVNTMTGFAFDRITRGRAYDWTVRRSSGRCGALDDH
jgi:predicted nuclease of predicted toxin-antitoxin system